jgi:hypothetical protein
MTTTDNWVSEQSEQVTKCLKFVVLTFKYQVLVVEKTILSSYQAKMRVVMSMRWVQIRTLNWVLALKISDQ